MELKEMYLEKYATLVENGMDISYEEFDKQIHDEWMQGLNLAYRYYIFHNNLDVPLDYIIDGFPLGNWIDEQRKFKRVLTVNQIEALSDMEMLWHLRKGHHKRRFRKEIRYGDEQYARWIENLVCAKKFFDENGHLNVPVNYVIYNEKGKKIRLGTWIQVQKRNYKIGRIPAERMSKLDNLFMVYDKTHQSEINRILKVKNHCYLPSYLKGADLFETKPLDVVFNKGHLSQKLRLEKNLNYCKAYFEENGHFNPKQTENFVLEDGTVVKIGLIARNLRLKHRNQKLSLETTNFLDSLDFDYFPKRGRPFKEKLSKNDLLDMKDVILVATQLQEFDNNQLCEFIERFENDFPTNEDKVDGGHQKIKQHISA